MSVTEFTTVIGICISLFALFKGVFEYIRQGKQKSAEFFLKMRDRIFDDDDFNKVQKALDQETESVIRQLSLAEKETYLLNSRVIITMTAA